MNTVLFSTNVDSAPGAPAPHRPTVVAAAPPALSPLVLVLDDEPLIGLDLADTLEDAGYRVAGPFVSGREAMAVLGPVLACTAPDGARPDLAVIDHVVHGAPCDEVVEALEALAVPVLVYSGRTQALAASAPFRRAAWLAKPAGSARLLRALGELPGAVALAAARGEGASRGEGPSLGAWPPARDDRAGLRRHRLPGAA